MDDKDKPSAFVSRGALAIANRMNHQPVMIEPSYSALGSDLMSLNLKPEEIEARARAEMLSLATAYAFSPESDTPPANKKPYAFSRGIGLYPITGTLINRFGSSWGFVTGYNFIRSMHSAMMADDDVHTIVADINSFGGEVHGCFELSRDLAAMRGKKRTIAMVDANCYSAAYALASAFDEIVITPSGGAGSIGVVAMHMSVEKLLNDIGIKVTFIHAGDHKVDGNIFQDLPADVRKDIQKSVNKSYDGFVGLVSANREMDEQAIRDTEARCYRAEDALKLGLVDRIASPYELIRSLHSTERSSSLTHDEEEHAMDPKEKEALQAAHKAEMDKAVAEAAQKAAAEARTAERARISGVLSSAEAEGRTELARHLALTTDMTAEQAEGILKMSPKKDAAAAPVNRFAQSMDANGGPQVGADAPDNTQQESDTDRILKDQAAIMGPKAHLKLASNNDK